MWKFHGFKISPIKYKYFYKFTYILYICLLNIPILTHVNWLHGSLLCPRDHVLSGTKIKTAEITRWAPPPASSPVAAPFSKVSAFSSSFVPFSELALMVISPSSLPTPMTQRLQFKLGSSLANLPTHRSQPPSISGASGSTESSPSFTIKSSTIYLRSPSTAAPPLLTHLELAFKVPEISLLQHHTDLFTVRHINFHLRRLLSFTNQIYASLTPTEECSLWRSPSLTGKVSVWDEPLCRLYKVKKGISTRVFVTPATFKI